MYIKESVLGKYNFDVCNLEKVSFDFCDIAFEYKDKKMLSDVSVIYGKTSHILMFVSCSPKKELCVEGVILLDSDKILDNIGIRFELDEDEVEALLSYTGILK